MGVLVNSLPLYEGVDWNSNRKFCCFISLHRLPLYEGVDWNCCVRQMQQGGTSLPLYEGVDWNNKSTAQKAVHAASPSLRGSGLKLPLVCLCLRMHCVSLFTREWIEMPPILYFISIILSPSLRGSGLKFTIYNPITGQYSLPLYEGVDWNLLPDLYIYYLRLSPSLRGSGLK